MPGTLVSESRLIFATVPAPATTLFGAAALLALRSRIRTWYTPHARPCEKRVDSTSPRDLNARPSNSTHMRSSRCPENVMSRLAQPLLTQEHIER
jgi:hypothetical protein